VVDHHFNDVAGRAVAGRIGDDGVEAVVAVGQAGLHGAGRRPAGAAIGRNFIGHTGAVGIQVAAQAEIERAVGGDRRGVGAAAVNEVSVSVHAGLPIYVVDHHFNDVAGRAVAGRI